MKTDEIRNKFMKQFNDEFQGRLDYDVLQTASNEYSIPWVDDEGNEGYITIVFRIPKGSRDGEPYDGYAVAEDYRRKVAEKAEKEKARAEAKAKKIEKDKALREKKSKEKETE